MAGPIDPKTLKAFAKKPAPGGAPPGAGAGAAPPAEEDAATDGVENTEQTAGDGDITTDEQLAQDVLAKVADSDVDEELVDLVNSGEAVEGTYPWVLDPDIWDRAMKSLDPDEVPQGVDPFVVLAHIYMAMGGKADGLEQDAGADGDVEPDGDEATGGDEPSPAGAPPPAAPPGKPKFPPGKV